MRPSRKDAARFRAKNLRVIARTERIPYDAYVVRSGFPTKAILGLQKAISSDRLEMPRDGVH